MVGFLWFLNFIFMLGTGRALFDGRGPFRYGLLVRFVTAGVHALETQFYPGTRLVHCDVITGLLHVRRLKHVKERRSSSLVWSKRRHCPRRTSRRMRMVGAAEPLVGVGCLVDGFSLRLSILTFPQNKERLRQQPTRFFFTLAINFDIDMMPCSL